MDTFRSNPQRVTHTKRLRVTIIFRLEDDTWKIVHRHTDTVITPRPHESMIKE
jgi:ketosteroid isomerase-like protein